MVFTCCVPNCQGNYPNTPKRQLFSFPKDEHLKAAWISTIHKENFQPTQNSKVCELHFAESDIETTTSAYDEKKGKLITASLFRSRLRKGAVPSLFPYLPSNVCNQYCVGSRTGLSNKKLRLETEQLEKLIQKRLQSPDFHDALYNESNDKTEKCTLEEQMQVLETTMEVPQIPTHSDNTLVPSSLPASQNWPGKYGFTLSFGPEEKSTKSDSWVYSKKKDKLYIKKDASCPINFSANDVLPNDVTIRAMALYSSPEQISEVVHRCLKHSKDELQKGVFEAKHLVRCESSMTSYEVHPTTKRHSVVVPFKNPPAGHKFTTYIYKFSCLGSCSSGPNRRPMMVVFTLENDNQVIGRRRLDVKICSSPRQHRKLDEAQLTVKEGSVPIKRKEQAEFVKLRDTLEFTKSVVYPPAKITEVVPNIDGKFTIMVDNLECYEFLKQMVKLYEICKVMKNLSPDTKRALIHYQRRKEEEANS